MVSFLFLIFPCLEGKAALRDCDISSVSSLRCLECRNANKKFLQCKNDGCIGEFSTAVTIISKGDNGCYFSGYLFARNVWQVVYLEQKDCPPKGRGEGRGRGYSLLLK